MAMRILFNGIIHTQDPDSPLVSAIAIDHATILACGEDQQIKEAFPAAESSLDLQRSIVIPGLTDSHIHLQNYALSLQKINCEGLSKPACINKVAESARCSKPGDWILGHGWNQNNWEDGFGTASDLDAISPNNPVYLSAKSLHAAWVNTEALNLAQIDPSTDSPEAGEIQRNIHGNPTGILFENAASLVSDIIPLPTLSEVEAAILKTQEKLLGMGITSIHDFDRETCFSALQSIQEKGELKLRVIKSIPLESLPQALDLGLRTGFGNDHLRIGSVKIFMDGALGPHTAAMIHPYVNDPGNRGMLFMDNEELFQQGMTAVKGGLSLAVHAIGDLANHETLDAMQRLRAFENKKNHSRLRHRIEHVQVLDPQDVPRLAEFGVIASMQPVHALSDMNMADQYWGSRASFAYAWKSQLDSGAILAFGSDAPVESPNPFWGIHAAVARRGIDGYPGSQGWYPEQRLSLDQALQAYTIGPAFAAGMENRVGKLKPGHLADLLILDRDLFHCDVEEIRDIQPSATMVGGKWVTGGL